MSALTDQQTSASLFDEVRRLRAENAELQADLDTATASDAQTQAINAELLEALQMLLRRAEVLYLTLYYAEQHGHRSDTAFVFARAAIAKAGSAA